MKLAVAHFPRPPTIEREPRRIRILLGGQTIVDTNAAWRILETTHPPTYYLPATAFIPGALIPGRRTSFCEWKGTAQFFSVTAGGRTEPDAAWYYADPSPAYAALRGHIAVYAGRMDACFIDDEQVTPQPGGFYGGWITSDLEGPFKGAPGTEFW
jgi:uncharacterized protein (DUF427 family)